VERYSLKRTETPKSARLPPRWFIRLFWSIHRDVYRWTGGRVGVWRATGWGDAEPAWWLNLEAHPDVTIELVDGARQVTGRAACGEERERLWGRWREINDNLDAFAARRSMQTAVVVLEPRVPT
jgi:hypothetical protein